MSEISRTALFGKLSPTAYRAIESATLFCKMRGNPYVELSHWIHQILQQEATDVARILTHFEVDAARLAKDLTQSLDRLPRGASSVSDLSAQVEESVERGWVYASLMFKVGQVRTGHLLVGWLKTTSLRNQLTAISREFTKLDAAKISADFDGATSGSCEENVQADAPESTDSGELAPAALGKKQALKKYSVDLIEQAKGSDPIVGRDEEIRQLIQVLLRRRQNNPILTGEAGVGKTAVVEGFAQRIASGDVPPVLRDVELRSLDIGLLQAGASMKGEFEQRLRSVIDEVQSSTTPIILFIDEAHTLVGAGGTQGTGDAANLLKPALARGKLRTVAATTWAEYKKYIEPDPALTRRFQVVQVDEPSTENAVRMLRATSGALETHHKLQVLDEALEAAVTLSKRFIPERQLPDKAVSLLDTACARVGVSQHGIPPEVENCRRTQAAFATEAEIVQRELDVGGGSEARKTELEDLLTSERQKLERLEARWSSEKRLIERILAIRASLRQVAEPGEGETPSREELLNEQEGLQAELKQLQGESPMLHATVDAAAIAAVVADWTGIPTGRMAKSEIETVLSLAEHLESRVIGQGHALGMIARRIQTAKAGLENPSKPIGVFLLAGPSGVGKTETALSLGEALYGGEQNVITINMSEFQEAHSVSTLKGAPPGYVGFGEGGVLTEAVRRRPYSVVLLDEVEKAHPDVHEIFFQVFDKGWMEDGQGVRIDFRNTIIILTSNVGSDVVMELCAAGRPELDVVTEAIRPSLGEAFPAALIGRMVTIPYYPLNDEVLGTIVRLQLTRVSSRVQERYGIPLEYDDSVVQLIISRCTELESGGRMIDAVLTNTLLPEVSQELLMRTLDGRGLVSVGVRAESGKFQYTFE